MNGSQVIDSHAPMLIVTITNNRDQDKRAILGMIKQLRSPVVGEVLLDLTG